MKNNSSARPEHPALYEEAFRDYFTDYNVLKKLARRDAEAVEYGTNVDYESGPVDELYRRYLDENKTSDGNPVHIGYFKNLLSNRGSVIVKITSDPVFAEYLVNIYETAYNTKILELIKAGLELYPESYTASDPTGYGSTAGVDSWDVDQTAEDGEEFSAETRISLARFGESLKDLNDNNVVIFGRDAVLSARAAGDAAIREAIREEETKPARETAEAEINDQAPEDIATGTVSGFQEVNVQAAIEANEKSKKLLEDAIKSRSNRYKLPSPKKKIKDIPGIMGKVNKTDDAEAAFAEIKVELGKLPKYTFI